MADMREIVGRNVREARKAQGWTQEEFAERAGISREHIAVIETGKRWASAEMVEKIAETLQMPAARLFFAPEALTLDTALATVLDALGYEPTVPARRRRGRS